MRLVLGGSGSGGNLPSWGLGGGCFRAGNAKLGVAAYDAHGAGEPAKGVFPHVPAGGAAHPLDAAGFKAPPFDATGFVANRFDASGPWSPWW